MPRHRKVAQQECAASEGVAEHAGQQEAATKPAARVVRRRCLHTFWQEQDKERHLPSHKWHAKRLEMASLWGWRLPLGMVGKGRGSRAVLRSQCCAYDASAFTVHQVSGRRDAVQSSFGRVVKPFRSEDGYFHAMLYDDSPEAVAPVRCLLRHVDNKGGEPLVQVWIQVHPAAAMAASKILQDVSMANGMSFSAKPLASIELFGPAAVEVLCRVLLKGNGRELAEIASSPKSAHAFSVLSPDPRARPAGGDDRATECPEPQIDREPSDEASEDSMQPIGESILWNEPEGWPQPLSEEAWSRLHARSRRRPWMKIMEPCSDDDSLTLRKSCPIILCIDSMAGQSHRITMMTSQEWAVPLWHSTVRAGVRPIGLRERHWVLSSLSQLCFPYDFPDTRAFANHYRDELRATVAEWLKRPKSKRSQSVPVSKLAQWPFNCPMVSEDDSVEEMNGRGGLPGLQESCDMMPTVTVSRAAQGQVLSGEPVRRVALGQIRVRIVGKGVLQPMAMLFHKRAEAVSFDGSSQDVTPVGFVTSASPRDSATPAIGFCSLEWLTAQGLWDDRGQPSSAAHQAGSKLPAFAKNQGCGRVMCVVVESQPPP